jgi:DNA-3-methyladenine glycosylase
MRRRRGVREERLICSGPGRVCQALGINRAHNGLPLDSLPFELRAAAGRAEIAVGPRIGISKAMEHPWRFGLAHSPFLSRPFGP